MINNEKQCRITKNWIKHFEAGLAKLEKHPESKEQPWRKGAQRRSVEGTLQQMYAELAEYEGKKSMSASKRVIKNRAKA